MRAFGGAKNVAVVNSIQQRSQTSKATARVTESYVAHPSAPLCDCSGVTGGGGGGGGTGYTGPRGPTGPAGVDGLPGLPGPGGASVQGSTGPTGAFGGIAVQSIVPDADNVYDLGSSELRFRHLYLGTNSISIGDAVISASGTAITMPPGTTIGGVNPGTIVIKGTVESTDFLPSDATIGDSYIIGEDLYVCTVDFPSDVTGWTNVGTIKGPQGDVGPTGPVGLEGPMGIPGEASLTGATGHTR